MKTVNCPDCGTPFDQDQPWKKVCTDCYFARKERTGERRVAQLQEQVEYWKNIAQGDKADEVKKLSRRCEDLSSSLAGARMKLAHLEIELMQAHSRNQPKPPRYTGESIPAEMMTRLIRLCHPDRHGNSEMATKATQWLLERR